MNQHEEEIQEEELQPRWLREIQQSYKLLDIEKSNGKYILVTTTHGTIDFFLKANKILLRKDNQWIENGLDWIIENILKS